MGQKKQFDLMYCLTGEITHETFSKVHEAIKHAESVNAAKLIIRICSSGGSVDDGFGIYDLLRTAKIPIETEAFGTVASMAVLVWCSAAVRRIAPETCVMLHPGQVSMGGRNLMESKALIDESIRQHFRYCKLISEKCVRSVGVNDVLEMAKSETYMTAAEAKDWGIATEVMEYCQ